MIKKTLSFPPSLKLSLFTKTSDPNGFSENPSGVLTLSDLDDLFNRAGLGDALIKKSLYDIFDRTPIMDWLLARDVDVAVKPPFKTTNTSVGGEK
jgi:hypothetical protein